MLINVRMEQKEWVAYRLRAYRRKNNLTQAQLGKMLGGITDSMVHKIESGQALTVNRLVQIATLLGVTVDELVKGEPEHAATKS